MKRRIICWIGAALVAITGHANAEVFSGTVADLTTEASASFRFKSAEDAIEQFESNNLQRILPGYTDNNAVNSDVNFRGVPMVMSFPEAGSTLNPNTLSFSVPDLNFSTSFTGATRTESVRQLIDFLKNNSFFLSRLGKLLVARSPADPLAGNPASLQSSMVGSDFAMALWIFNPDFIPEDEEQEARSNRIMLAQAGGPPSAVGAARTFNNLAGAGISGLSMSHEDVSTTAATIPLQYNVRSDVDPRRGFSLRLPLTYASFDGSVSTAANLGLAYRIPVQRRWVITPTIGYGAAYSRDLASIGHFVSGAVMSSYGFKLPGADLVLANMIGHYRSLKFSGGDFSYDPKISNTVFRNGLLYSRPFELAGARRSGQVYLIDTRMTGTELFIENWQEIGVNIGTRPRINAAREYGSLGLGYLHSPRYKGFTVQASYLF
ncbi:MAG TPA: hypothetical protein VFR86_18000 [Burkholderiaceae bacterium]|nr:hypothetical protein [Burkholderiaceae bacterium]